MIELHKKNIKMKQRIFFSFLLSFSFYLLSSQVPQGFNYQAIARDISGNTLTNQSLPVRITIQSDSLGGSILWIEDFPAVTTNSFGLFNVIIGQGARQAGSTVAAFRDIDWKVSPKFINTKIYYQLAWKNMGTTRFWSVPYSQMSGGLTGSVNKLTVKGDVISMDSTLFEVKNSTGQTIFAVYPEGVRVFVDDGIAKGATKGGFAIGGFGTVKAPSQEYLRVTRDSTRVYVNPLAKGNKGGFAIGGFGGKATPDNFLNLSVNNYLIGQQAGKSITTGVYNSFMGYQAGMNTTTGSENVFLGYKTGAMNNSGTFNVFIGDSAGASNTSGNTNILLGNYAGMSNIFGANNVYIGYKSGYLNLYGGQNICIGDYSGYNNITGQNLFIGEYAGEKNTYGTRNSFVGFFAGQDNVVGQLNSYFGQFAGMNNLASNNTFIGYWAGGLNVNGANNVFVGFRAGQGSAASNSVYLGYQAGEGNTGTSNVMLGYQAGYNSGLKSNVLYIANSSTAIPLVAGDFLAGRVGINCIPVSYNLEAASIGATNYYTLSDARYKTDIIPITNALDDVLRMQGVKYNWKISEFPSLNFSSGEQIGVIAQDLEKILPELVSTGTDGYKSVSYEKLTPVLIEAIKEQQKQIDELKALVNDLVANKAKSGNTGK
jgi:hypothetical protein